MSRQSLSGFDPLVVEWFARRFPRHRTADSRLAGDPRRPRRADLRADRLGQDAGGLPDLPRPAGARGAGRHACRMRPGGLRLAAQGAQQRHPQEPGNAARGDRRARRRARHPAGRRSAPRSAPATRPRGSASRWASSRRTFWSRRRNRCYILLTAEKARGACCALRGP